jgi:hypothetical protein
VSLGSGILDLSPPPYHTRNQKPTNQSSIQLIVSSWEHNTTHQQPSTHTTTTILETLQIELGGGRVSKYAVALPPNPPEQASSSHPPRLTLPSKQSTSKSHIPSSNPSIHPSTINNPWALPCFPFLSSLSFHCPSPSPNDKTSRKEKKKENAVKYLLHALPYLPSQESKSPHISLIRSSSLSAFPHRHPLPP